MRPAPTAHVLRSAPWAAYVEQEGIRVSASTDDWDGRPEDLSELMTPLKVRVTNRSGRPVRILYQDFALQPQGGQPYHPLPPAPLDAGPEKGLLGLRPLYASTGFHVAAAYKRLVPSLDAWPEPLPRDAATTEKEYHDWSDGLPTREMRRRALFEGVLEDQGVTAGYLYFSRRARAGDEVVFRADLADAQDGEPVASIDIPFVVE
ncbi:MAG TPA: hypothetical protein VIU64_14320 [Polyangia bacterium]